MQKIGEYEYPSLGPFKDALSIAEEALTKKYEGSMPVPEACKKIGLKVTNPHKLSGTYYAKLRDLAAFKLFEVESGRVKTLPLAERVFSADSTVATQAKAEAIRNIPVIPKLFEAFNGDIGEETAFPSKLEKALTISWQDIKNDIGKLRTLLIETFPYLGQSATTLPALAETTDKGGLPTPMKEAPQVETQKAVQVKPYGEVRTTIGTVLVRKPSQLKLARELLDQLEEEFGKEEN